MTKEKTCLGRITNFLTCRRVLNIMVIFGFMLNYALRVNLTIAIVAMVFDNETETTTTTAINNSSNGVISNGIHTLNTTETPATLLINGETKFNWDSHKQNFVLGCFFWGYILTELPGGRLAELIGGYRVFGHSMLWASVLTLLTPLAAETHYVFLIVVRVVLGFMLGASWPAIHPMCAVWIPPVDRSKFMSNMMASSLGAAITMPICGVLIAWYGWSSVFYATGGVGLLWSICWFLFIYENPAAHPRISAEERRYIEESIGTTTNKKRSNYFPWRQLISSQAVWAIIVTHGLSVFGFFTVINQLPTYMKTILHFDIKENGFFSSLPYLFKYIMAVSSSCLADCLRSRGTLSTTAVRKIFTTFALAVPGLIMILLGIMGESAAWSVTCFTLALFVHGAVTAGYLGNGLDIAPNFSGTIFGMANTLSSFGGFVSAAMVGELTQDDHTFHAWQIVFFILAATYISGAVVYLIFGTGELQSWNNPPENKITADAESAEPLKNGKAYD